MEYTCPEIDGEIININDLKFARAKDIALTVVNNPSFIFDPVFIKKDDKEIILLKLDIEVPLRNSNGIQETEDVAIVCKETDDSFPEVLALRDDFPLGLPHTNIRTTERPVSLCVSEQVFDEIKIAFNSFNFIESIRTWLSLTSQNKLHQEDQPLEPFLIVKGYVIIPKLEIEKDIFLQPLSEGSNLYQLNSKGNDTSIFCIGYKFDQQVSGFVHKEPHIIDDLSSLLRLKTKELASLLADNFNNINKEVFSTPHLHNKRLVIYCTIPIKRRAEDDKPEKTEVLFLLTKKSIKEIGIESSVWEETDENRLDVSKGKPFSPEHFRPLEIEIYGVMPGFDAGTASLYNGLKPNDNKYAVIGVGALGSQIMETFARIGFGRWTIIDHDYLYPHNLARHILERENLGTLKAISVASKLNNLLDDNRFTPICCNFNNNGNDKERMISALSNVNVILDISTSIAVARSLARDYTKTLKCKRISVFINPKGTDLVILAEDSGRKHRLDFLEMEYYRYLYRTEELHNHLKRYDKSKIRYNTNSCRDITTLLNQADIALLSSIASKSLQTLINNSKAAINIWQINEDCSVKSFTTKPSNWIKKTNDQSKWNIYINNELICYIQEQRKLKLPNETGGILLGCIDESRSIIYVFDTILAPKDSKEAPAFFERGKDGILDEFNKYHDITGGQIRYLGEWHSHPARSSTKPSQQDLTQCSFLVEKMIKEGRPALMGICGDNGFKMYMGDNYSKSTNGLNRSSFTIKIFN